MIYNLGSINAALFYQMDHLPLPGETLAAVAHSRGLGGKGANQSVAAARAGAKVCHIGAVGADGGWAIDRLAELGVETSGIAISEQQTGQAIINVDAQGENSIVLWSGANRNQSEQGISDQLTKALPGDILLLQNETDCQQLAANTGYKQELRVIYSAA
ncbi:MAG: PfkB family carbohydrate kinase, partial [Paracoccaceae bacterium]